MIRVEIRTTDQDWSAAHATPGRDGRVVTTAREVSRRTVQATGRELVTFTMPGPIPADWPNATGFAPVEWIVEN